MGHVNSPSQKGAPGHSPAVPPFWTVHCHSAHVRHFGSGQRGYLERTEMGVGSQEMEPQRKIYWDVLKSKIHVGFVL